MSVSSCNALPLRAALEAPEEGKLFSGLIQKTAEAIIQADLRAFDANPADHACQTRAILIHDLSGKEALKEEAERLQSGVDGEVSSDFDFLRHAYLLTAIRVDKEASPTDPRRLKQVFETKISNGRLKKIVGLASTALSAMTVTRLQALAEDLCAQETQERLREVRVEKTGTPKVERSFVSGFYQVKAVLDYVEKHKVPVILRSAEGEKLFPGTGSAALYVRGEGQMPEESIRDLLLGSIAKIDDGFAVEKEYQTMPASCFAIRHIYCAPRG